MENEQHFSIEGFPSLLFQDEEIRQDKVRKTSELIAKELKYILRQVISTVYIVPILKLGDPFPSLTPCYKLDFSKKALTPDPIEPQSGKLLLTIFWA